MNDYRPQWILPNGFKDYFALLDLPENATKNELQLRIDELSLYFHKMISIEGTAKWGQYRTGIEEAAEKLGATQQKLEYIKELKKNKDLPVNKEGYRELNMSIPDTDVRVQPIARRTSRQSKVDSSNKISSQGPAKENPIDSSILQRFQVEEGITRIIGQLKDINYQELMGVVKESLHKGLVQGARDWDTFWAGTYPEHIVITQRDLAFLYGVINFSRIIGDVELVVNHSKEDGWTPTEFARMKKGYQTPKDEFQFQLPALNILSDLQPRDRTKRTVYQHTGEDIQRSTREYVTLATLAQLEERQLKEIDDAFFPEGMSAHYHNLIDLGRKLGLQRKQVDGRVHIEENLRRINNFAKANIFREEGEIVNQLDKTIALIPLEKLPEYLNAQREYIHVVGSRGESELPFSTVESLFPPNMMPEGTIHHGENTSGKMQYRNHKER